MCGIMGMINGHDVVPDLVDGLGRLAYRGYDSAGVAIVSDGAIARRRAAGKLANLKTLLTRDPIAGGVGIAHTRWATHGGPSADNAHPHANGRVAVVHNGIVENFRELREELTAAGHVFTSETDTEVIPHLIADFLDTGMEPDEATAAAIRRLEGCFALGVIFEGRDDMLVATRRGSPLAVSQAAGGTLLASDVMALAPVSREVILLEDDDIAVLGRAGIEIRDRLGRRAHRSARVTGASPAAIEKNGYRHFMQKEIFEQPRALRRSLAGCYDAGRRTVAFPDLPVSFEKVPRLSIVACGTSHHAALVAKYWFEQYARLPVEADIASEFRYRDATPPEGGLALFISQSGETADTLAALRHAAENGQQTLALVNVAGSTLAREADAVLHTGAGPEIGVASTKAFTTQLSVLAALAVWAGQTRHVLSDDEVASLSADLGESAALAERALATKPTPRGLANEIKGAGTVLFMGRGASYPIALEGALKLKEISYIHAEGYAAGELKHGPIALIDAHVPVVVVAPRDPLFEKTMSNLREVKARGGKIILLSDAEGIAAAPRDLFATIEVPSGGPLTNPILYTLPLQLLAYHVAVLRGTDIDQPRNLAKSVTVE